MKSIKKSKIIVPALGLLLLSTAASVSGTVAWFTANRTFSTTVSQFSVYQTEGNLACTMAAGTGTEYVAAGEGVTGDAAGKVVKILTGAKMGDASYCHTGTNAGHLFVDNSDSTNESTGANSGSFLDLNSSSTAETSWVISTGTAFHAVSWNMTFSYTFGADTTPQDIFFDNSVSLMTATAQVASEATKQTGKAFRIAFVVSGGKTLVWADLQTKANCKYTSATNAAPSSYVDNNHDLIASDTYNEYSFAANGASTNHDRNDYIGQITKPNDNTVGSLTVHCVAWFEGNDENIVNNARMDNVSAKMGFYARTAYVA